MTVENGHPAPQDSLILELVKLRDEYGRYLQLTNLELQDREKLIGVVKYLQAWVGRPVPLSPGALGGGESVRQAQLTGEGLVVIVDSRGTETKTPLDQFDAPTFLSLIQDCTPKLAALVQEKNRAMVEANAPRIKFNIALTGGHLLLFDWRVYKLSVYNQGSEARGLRLSVGKAPSQSYGPLTVRKGEAKNLDLSHFRQLSALDSIPIEMSCRDADGREYKGSGVVKAGGDAWQEIPFVASQMA